MSLTSLNLKKNNIANFEVKQICLTDLDDKEKTYSLIEQDINRSWNLMAKTHILEPLPSLYSLNDYNVEDKIIRNMPHISKMNEVLCIRALIAYKKTKRKIGNHELIITAFDEDNYNAYQQFVKKHLFHRDAIYNLYYNIYNMDYLKGVKYNTNYNKKMIGSSVAASSTNILPIDLDAYTFEEYKQIRQLFIERGIIPIEIFSGHGFHLLIRIEKSEDKDLMEKWLQVLDSYHIEADKHCVDTGRTLRLPFFYNIKQAKYDFATKADIMEGEYYAPIYIIEEVFQKFGFDYKNFQLHVKDKKPITTKIKKVKPSKKNIIPNTLSEEELTKLYPILDLTILPKGIKSMLKGFVEGYTYYQLMCLVLYLKKCNLELEEIKEITSITASINGNDWNSWDTVMQTEDFYHSIYAINKKELCNLESQFGAITFPYNANNYKIPLGVMKPSALKLYMFLLLYGSSKKIEIETKLKYSRNKIYNIVNTTNMIIKNKLNYEVVDKRVKNYIFLTKEELEQYLEWSENEIAIYLYLKFRCGKNNCIQTSIDSIKLGTLLSHSIITSTIQLLESKNLVSTVRKEYKVKQDLRESNTYTLLIE